MLLDCCLIFILAAALVKPYFKARYTDKWASIESTFISDARFLKDHWPHPRWQPLWYGGTRFDYVYPPALRYGTAVLTRIAPILPVKAYHIYAAFFYCFGIAGVYLFIRLVSGSRGAGWLGAAATALVSPSFLFLPAIRADAWLWVPQRLGVLTRYGEGPHMTALAWIAPALAFAWLALRSGRPLALAAAAVAGAMVVSNNFYGATAYAALYPILVWSLWVTHRERAIWYRAAAIPLLTYGLTAFWLVPSYFAITTANMKFVSERGNTWSLWILLGVSICYILATGRLARGRREAAYAVFLAGAVVFFGLNVLGNFAFHFRVVGDPTRWVPELDLALTLAAVEGLRRLWNVDRARLAVRAACAVLVLVSLGTAARYVAHAWQIYPLEPDYHKRVEYYVQDWVARNLPGERLVATGSVRFWYDTWNDLPQLWGGSEQGVQNGIVIPAQWQILQGESAPVAIDWMVALGVDAIIVHDRNSSEWYHDFTNPRKFAGILPVLYDSGRGDVIYRVPRRAPGLARVVDAARAANLRPVPTDSDTAGLQAYVAAVERGTDAPASTTWQGSDALVVRAKTAPGQAVVVQVTYDPAWHAYADGQPLRVRRDAVGFMLIDCPPGEREIRLVFELPLENAAGRGLTALTLAALLALAVVDVRRRRTTAGLAETAKV